MRKIINKLLQARNRFKILVTIFLSILALTLCSPIDGMASIIDFLKLHGDARSRKFIMPGSIFSTYHLMPREKTI